MGAERPAREVLARFESSVAKAVSGRERACVAFSGGLGSLILAAVARKRLDLRCVVVGPPKSADVEAAILAQTFLDYPVEVLQPEPEAVLARARALRREDPSLPMPDLLSLLPLALVQDRCAPEPVLHGFGFSPRSRALDRRLKAAGFPPPGLQRGGAASPDRRMAVAVADALGIPDAFSRVGRRTPAEGSGIGPALRALGHERHTSVARLVGTLV